jgi:AcrR family transcriptional regulator
MTTKQQIFEAAKRRFEREGLTGLSMRTIAKDVGITAMAIYRHYPDKEALTNALMRNGISAWEERVRAIQEDDPIQWLHAASEAFLAFALEEPRQYEAAFLLPATQARRYPDDFAAGRSPAVAILHDRIEHAKKLGMIGNVSATEMGLTLSALGQGLVSLYEAGRFVGEPEFCAAYRMAMLHCIHSFLRNDCR